VELPSFLAAVRAEISPHLAFLGEIEAKAGTDLQAAERDLAQWIAGLAGDPATRNELAAIRCQLDRIEQTLEKIMSEDAAVQAVVADENTQIANLTTAVTALQGLVAALQAEPPTALQPTTLAALQSADAALDTIASTASADVTADTPATPPAS